MTSLRPRTSSLFVTVALACAFPLQAQDRGLRADAKAGEQFDIGSRGAQVRLGSPWQRKEITKDVGKDQFVATQGSWLLSGERTVYVIAREIHGPLENEPDYRAAMDDSCTLGHETKIEIATLANGAARASRTFDADVDGTACAFRCELLAKDGIAYHFMVWSLASQARTMKARANQVVDGFAFPGPDTEHGKGARPTTRSVTVAGHLVEYSVRPSVMKSVEASFGSLADYASLDDAQRLEIAPAVSRRIDKDARIAGMLDAERRQLASSADSLAEHSRGNVEIDGVLCGFLLCQQDGTVVKLLCIPLGQHGGVTFRWRSEGDVAAARPERDACFASIRLKRADAEFELPEIPEQPAYEDHSAVSRLLATGRRVLAPLPTWSARILRHGAAYVAFDWSRVFVEERGEWPLRYEGRSIRGAAVAAGALYVLEDEVVRRVDASGFPVLPRKSNRIVTCIASFGDSLIALCAPAPLPGIADRAAPLAVVRLDADGTETDLGEAGCVVCEHAAWHESRNELLVAGGVHPLAPSLRSEPERQTLWCNKLDGKPPASWGLWVVVRQIVAVADGFLVSGQPVEGVDGAHLLRGPTDRELMLAASTRLFLAAGFDGAELVVVATRSGASNVLALPLAACKKDGLKCQPFSRASIEAIGDAMLRELVDRVPNTKAEVRSARDRADAFAVANFHSRLPRQAPDVEALVLAMGAEGCLSEDGRVLCAMLVAASAIDAGGEWIPGPKPAWSAWRTCGPAVADTSLAVVVQPTAQVVAALDDSEGTMTLVRDADVLGGQALLVGVDAAALSARVASLVPQGYEAALLACDVGRLAGVLAANGSSHGLRRHAYAVLAGRGRLDAMEALAAPFAVRGDAREQDVVAWLAARTASASVAATDEAQWREMCARGLAALHRFPGSANLCLLLGRAAERAFPTAPGRARSCYERVLAMSSYGDEADAARKALAR